MSVLRYWEDALSLAKEKRTPYAYIIYGFGRPVYVGSTKSHHRIKHHLFGGDRSSRLEIALNGMDDIRFELFFKPTLEEVRKMEESLYDKLIKQGRELANPRVGGSIFGKWAPDAPQRKSASEFRKNWWKTEYLKPEVKTLIDARNRKAAAIRRSPEQRALTSLRSKEMWARRKGNLV